MLLLIKILKMEIFKVKKKLILPLVITMFFNIVPTYAITENDNINSSKAITKVDTLNNGNIENAINLGYWDNPGTAITDITIKDIDNNSNS